MPRTVHLRYPVVFSTSSRLAPKNRAGRLRFHHLISQIFATAPSHAAETITAPGRRVGSPAPHIFRLCVQAAAEQAGFHGHADSRAKGDVECRGLCGNFVVAILLADHKAEDPPKVGFPEAVPFARGRLTPSG